MSGRGEGWRMKIRDHDKGKDEGNVRDGELQRDISPVLKTFSLRYTNLSRRAQ